MVYISNGESSQVNRLSRSMRMNRRKPFTGRKSCTKEARHLYIFFTEGSCTEQIYLNELKTDKRVKQNIKLEVLNRGKGSSGRANPKTMLLDIIEFMAEVSKVTKNDNSRISQYYDELCVVNSPLSRLEVTIQELRKLTDKYPKILSEDKNGIKQQLYSISLISTYDPLYDKICLIIDRDECSFTEDQFDEVIEKCSEYGFELGISNPCFEFFLLMHLSNLDSIDKECLIENAKENKKTFTQRLLEQYTLEISGSQYKKEKYNAPEFISKIDIGIQNINNYEIENERLKNSVGSSVFRIIESIMDLG